MTRQGLGIDTGAPPAEKTDAEKAADAARRERIDAEKAAAQLEAERRVSALPVTGEAAAALKAWAMQHLQFSQVRSSTPLQLLVLELVLKLKLHLLVETARAACRN